MELKWNLSSLFQNDEECTSSFNEIDDMIEKLEEYKGTTLTASKLEELLKYNFACLELSYKCLVYGSLRYYADIKNEDMQKLKRDVEIKNNNTVSALSFVKDMIISIGENKVTKMMEENPALKKYKNYFNDIFRKQSHLINTERVNELTNEIGEYIKKYLTITGEIAFEPITVDGKEIELTQTNIAKYLNSHTKETRDTAYASLNTAYKKIESEVATILNEIVKRRIEIAKLENYESPLARTLDEENVDMRIFDGLLKIVDSKKHLLERYMKLKAKILGIKNPFLYDLGISLNPEFKMKYPLEDSINLIKDAFKPLGEQYTSLALSLMQEGHIDATPREEKHPTIVFSWYSYSFMNYKDNYNDIKNLVHELGHSMNDKLSLSLPFPYRISTVFIGETASIVNEILLNRMLISKSATDEEQEYYVNKEIDNFITSIYRQTMYTEFELNMYKRAQEGKELTVDFLRSTYAKILKSYYGDSVTYDQDCSCEWMRIGRLFRWSFYSYTYATGLLIASTVHSNLINGTLPFEDYLEFLSLGSQEYPKELLQKLHIDISNLRILESGFDILEKDIQMLEKKYKDKTITLD